MSATIAVNLHLQKTMFDRLAERARALGKRPAEYLRMLLEAAYAARCVAERGGTFDDAELDRQVKLTFAFADCEPEYIAATIGMPVERAKRILEGWRIVAGVPLKPAPAIAPPAPALEVPDAAIPPPAPAPKLKRWTDAEILLLKERWAAGAEIAAIAAELGRSAKAVEQYVNNHRALCPTRR